MPIVNGTKKNQVMKKKKKRKGLEISTLNKLLTRFSLLLARIKAGNNWCKLKNKIRQILFLGEHIVDNKLVITKEPKHYCFDLPKDADNILDHEIIKHDELLA